MAEPSKFDWNLVTSHIVNYQDCNQLGNLFGGTLMAWIDIAASIFCRRATNVPIVVTKTIDKMVFHTPSKLGETICIYCKVNSVGTTSLTVDVRVTNQSYGGKQAEEREVATTTMVWVAINEQRRPYEWAKPADLQKRKA